MKSEPHKTKTPQERTSSSAKESDILSPEDVLVDFFSLANEGHYKDAVGLLFLDDYYWEFMSVFSTESDLANKELILKDFCFAVGTCLTAKPLKTEKVNDNEYVVTTEFLDDDGSVFVYGPCCGATEEEMPPVREFEYTVVRNEGVFMVATPPLYMP